MRRAGIVVAGIMAMAAQEGAAAPAATKDAGPRPIVDTHIHFWQVTRPQGVPWPSPANKTLYRDVTPAEYKAVARKLGIVGTGIMEASNVEGDNEMILELVKGDPFFEFFVAQLDLSAPDFVKRLDALAKDARVVGIRGFLWSPTLTLDAVQLAHLRALAERGMTLDIISRGTLNPKDKVEALARAVPDLRIIIDHLAGARGAKPDPAWEKGLRALAQHPNLYIKLSSFFDMFNPAAPSEDNPWKAPTELSAYKPHFDVLMAAFGPDRLVWGSNWPVVELGGGLAREIAIAEAYLAPLGPKVRDKVMFENARELYRRKPPAKAR